MTEMESNKAMVIRDDGKTKIFIAVQPGVFKGGPQMVWDRELLDSECYALLENPWGNFLKPTPEGNVRQC